MRTLTCAVNTVFKNHVGSVSAVVTGNNSSNNVRILNKKGKQLSSFDFDGPVSDITVYKKTIFILSDCYLFAFDFEGSNKHSIARFYKQFGSKPHNYFSVTKYYRPLFAFAILYNRIKNLAYKL